MSMKFLVLYYDGNDTKAKLVIHDRPEEIVRETVGCPPFGDINAIIQMPDHAEYMQVTERDDLALLIYDQREAISGDKVIIYAEDC